ncbi:MAG: tRNA (N(6)-L-threonylcarbamoyladenosine(37)-C(2))-methylthiotransferase MtaB [Clostridiales bacterium]
MEKSVAFYTLGCKVNQYETEAVIEIFQKDGYKILDFKDFADIYIINTCTVTSVSDKKSRQMIRRARQKNKNALIIMMGCYSQVSQDEAEKLTQVDIIIGSTGKNKVLEYIKEFKPENGKKVYIEDLNKNKEYDDMSISTYKENTRAYIKIQDGCDRYCSYCIIPFARGKVRSRNYESVINEVETLGKEGFKEIILTGIHLASYGKERNDITLIGLIKKIDQVSGIERIRLSSLEPLIIDRKFVEFAKTNEKLCKHFHLSLQSGSDNVLKLMNRRYTTFDYLEKVKLLKENLPGVSLTTDLIVGFPGETDEDLIQTAKFIKSVGFLKVHVFKFSERKGTKAAKLKNKVNSLTKDTRSKKIIEISDNMSIEFRKKFLGERMSIIVEQNLSTDSDYLVGFTENYIKVIFKGDFKKYKGKLCNVELIKINDDFVEGCIIN